ncbi:glycosyltransferase family 4 protein [Bacillus salacetis]|uniref:glycosyltransferase family 4 protein n=1 Tax=Bacillus salacetis TaxID=2315464 RepID=UPI003B9EFAC5
MRLLHISSYYITNKLYMNLYKQLSHEGFQQEVFIPVKEESLIGVNQLPEEFTNVNYFYKNIIKKYDKYLYHNKINKQMKHIEQDILTGGNVDFIHAHTVFSDGGSAYKLHKKYGTDYIVNVRNTDINFFYKYAIHLRPFMYKVLRNAKAIVFLSHAYKQKTFDLLPVDVLTDIEHKCHIIPNGIDDYWHSHTPSQRLEPSEDQLRLLFIGLLDENKNLGAVLSACSILKEQGKNVYLEVAGSGPLEEKNKQMCKELNITDNVTFHGYVKDQEKIRKIMGETDVFVMPSFRETFGLVYIEAMSQGIPVIYSEGQGIDGVFENGEVGYAVDPHKPETIVEAINNVRMSYEEMSANGIRESKGFKWANVAARYKELYEK